MGIEHHNKLDVQELIRKHMYFETNRARYHVPMLDTNPSLGQKYNELYFRNLCRRFQFLARSFERGSFNVSKFHEQQMYPSTRWNDLDDRWEVALYEDILRIGKKQSRASNVFLNFERWSHVDQNLPYPTFLLQEPEDIEDNLLGLALGSDSRVQETKQQVEPFLHEIGKQYGGVCLVTNFASGLPEAGFVANWFSDAYPSCNVLQAIARCSPEKEEDSGWHVFQSQDKIIENAKSFGYPLFLVDHFLSSGRSLSSFFNWTRDYPSAAFISRVALKPYHLDYVLDRHPNADYFLGEEDNPYGVFFQNL